MVDVGRVGVGHSGSVARSLYELAACTGWVAAAMVALGYL